MKKVSVYIIRGILKMLSLLPLKVHYFMGSIVSGVARNVLKYRSDVVWVNLARSFPDMKYKELKKVYDDFYCHFGEIIAEAVWFSGSDNKRLKKTGIVRMTNPDLISDIYSRSSSVTMLSTHCGNWELMGGFFAYVNDGCQFTFSEEHITVVYKKLSSAVADEVFKLNRIAPLERVGVECEVESRDILRFALKHKDEKRIYIYPADQAPYWKAGKHPIGEFMHQQTNAMIGSMGMACKLGHSVVYMKMKRVERGNYEISFIPICEDASQMSAETVLRKYYDLLEEEINETPGNWLWSHKRWK